MGRATAVAVAALIAAAPGPATAAGDAQAALAAAQQAYDAGDYAQAVDRARAGLGGQRAGRASRDYLLWVGAQAAFLTGDPDQALAWFTELARGYPGSRFAPLIPWRIADCRWALGDHQAARDAYQRLIAGGGDGERAVARLRVAEANRERGKLALARGQLREILLEHPSHPAAARAAAVLRALGGEAAAALSPAERVARARHLSEGHLWDEAIAELRLVGDDAPAAVRRDRDFWTGATLFAMRRRYGDAGSILLAVSPQMGDRADWALFHGARALSRADRDAEAITWYQKLVATYPHSTWAPEAQYLSGWLEFSVGHFRESLPGLERMGKLYPSSKWAREARWYRALAHYQLGELDQALPLFAAFSHQGGRLDGGKGQYWHARTLEQLGRGGEAAPEYRELVGRFPFSWYALLARARLAAAGVDIDPFGDAPSSARGAAIADAVDPALAGDPLMQAADELIAAGLPVAARFELRRGERAFLGRHPRGDALAALFDRYARARDWNRPWYLAITNGSSALDAPPVGRAKIWWQHAYPLAYPEMLERWRDLGKNPRYYLESIMRKESGFDPHDVSYADAYGLLQMIPPTTRRVAEALGIPYTSDLLYDPEANIRTGSWYIGRLLHKFRGQIPIGAGSFNSGPRPWMKWLDAWGDRPIDELIELVPYRQTREYAKKVTENYARYLYLYDGTVYQQPLTVDRAYQVDDLTY